MPTSDAITVTALDRIEEAVWVTTDSTPPTSLPSRDWMSPVRVPVKKPRCIDSRCTNSRLRRSCMTRLPSEVVRNVCPTPISADTIGITIMSGDQDEQQLQVGAAGHEQGLVEHRPGQERVRDPQHRGHQDRRPDQRQPRRGTA